MVIEGKDGKKFDFEKKDAKSNSRRKFLDKYAYLKGELNLVEAYKTLKGNAE